MDPAAIDPQRFDPRRRRAKVGGLMLVALGIVSVLAFSAVIALAGQFSLADNQGVLGGQPGGPVTVVFTDNGTAVAGADVILAWSGGGVNGTTDADGTFKATAGGAQANVTIRHSAADNQTWVRDVLSLDSMPVTVAIDTGDPTTSDEPVAAPLPTNSIRAVAGFFLFISAFVLAGGVAAYRLKGRGIAIGGALAGLLPLLIMVTAVPNIATMVLLLLMAVALVFVWQARSLFR